jgi:hypothetical protein
MKCNISGVYGEEREKRKCQKLKREEVKECIIH